MAPSVWQSLCTHVWHCALEAVTGRRCCSRCGGGGKGAETAVSAVLCEDAGCGRQLTWSDGASGMPSCPPSILSGDGDAVTATGWTSLLGCACGSALCPLRALHCCCECSRWPSLCKTRVQ